MQVPSLYERNLDILSSYFNDQTKEYLKQATEYDIELITASDASKKVINLKINDEHFYPDNAHDHCRQQNIVYQKKPIRLFYHDKAADLEKTTNYVPRNTSEHIVKAVLSNILPFEETSKKNNLITGYGISFGLGIGFHLKDFVDNNLFQDLIICEGYIDFLQASMHSMDWAPIVEVIKSRNGQIHFLFNSNPQYINLSLSAMIQSYHPGLLEGSFVYQHHSFGPIPEAISRFRESFSQIISYNGWLDDELVHLNNVMDNIKNRNFSPLITVKPEINYSAPVLIIGSGPSLKNDLTTIRAIRDKVTIISSGSALSVLLAEGISPDYHCELENVEVLNSIFERLQASYDLSQISLLASFTINTKVTKYFKDVTFFPREGAGICTTLRGPIEHIPYSGRTATLSALSIALYLNCQNIFLFGLDFAAADDGSTHSPNSIYGLGISGIANGSGQGDINRQVPGNFAKTVITNNLWTYMRQGVEVVVKKYLNETNVNIYNCSGGARIEGAITLRASELEKVLLSSPPSRKLAFQTFLLREAAQDTIEIISKNLNFIENIKPLLKLAKKFLSLKNEIEENNTELSPILELNELLERHVFNAESSNAVLSGSFLRGLHILRYKSYRSLETDLSNLEKQGVLSFCDISIHVILYFASCLAVRLNGSIMHDNIFPDDLAQYKNIFNLYINMQRDKSQARAQLLKLQKNTTSYWYTESLFKKFAYTKQDDIIELANLYDSSKIPDNRFFPNQCVICGSKNIYLDPKDPFYVLSFKLTCGDCNHEFTFQPQAENTYFYRGLRYKHHIEKDEFFDFKQYVIKEVNTAFPDAPKNTLMEFDSLDCEALQKHQNNFGYEQSASMPIHPTNLLNAKNYNVSCIDPTPYFSKNSSPNSKSEKVSALFLTDVLAFVLNPVEFLKSLADYLEEDGVLMGLIPAEKCLYARQLQHFSDKSLKLLLSYNFEDIQIGQFPPYLMTEKEEKKNFLQYTTGKHGLYIVEKYFYCRVKNHD